jgi:Zn-dependent protease with chaperone function
LIGLSEVPRIRRPTPRAFPFRTGVTPITTRLIKTGGVVSACLLVCAISAGAQTSAQPAYSLPPDKLAKAVALYHEELLLEVGSMMWGFFSLWLILRLGIANALTKYSGRTTSRPWLQGFVYLPLLLLLLRLIHLPFWLAGHHMSLAFGLSIQGWLSWFVDWAKGMGLTIAGGTMVISILFAIVRHAPRLWWFWFWLISIPIIVGGVYIVPLFIDPMFNHYEPLEKTNPALVAQLERVVAKSGMMIPPSRMYLMKASEKVTTANAYVTGFGSSKRVVVWDTTIHSSTPDGILFVFGHELGHYVLGHVVTGVVLSIGGSLVFLWLAYHLAHWMVRRYGQRWHVPSMASWSAVVVLLLAAQILGFFSDPIQNAISRSMEHHADIYGEEVIHGIVADPQHTAQQSFQQLGEGSLDIPNPNRFVVFWTYTHPTTLERATFALRYDPWAPGHTPKYVR